MSISPKVLRTKFHISNPKNCKLHAAVRDREDPNQTEPYDIVKMYETKIQWRKWNNNAPRKDYNRKYIFSIVRHPKVKDSWLFAGIFVVSSNPPLKQKWSKKTWTGKRAINRYVYTVRLDSKTKHLIRKVEIKFVKKNPRVIRFNLESQLPRMTIVRIHKTKQ